MIRAETDVFGDNSAGQLRSLVERIERIDAERREKSDDIKEVYSEAKGAGYEPAIIRKLVALRRQDRDKRERDEAVLEAYLAAVGLA